MVDVSVSSERPALDHAEDGAVLFMLTISTNPKAAEKAADAKEERAGKTPSPHPSDEGAAAGASPTSVITETAPSTTTALDTVCSLEGCGLGWRVRPPLVRRSPWSVAAQRMRLCVEALGGAKIEKVYTLLDHHELAPCISYEVSVGDLHAGESIHVPVLLWLPALAAAVPSVEAVRFSLHYVDAVKIDTKSCELCASIARPAVRALPHAHEHSTPPRTPRKIWPPFLFPPVKQLLSFSPSPSPSLLGPLAQAGLVAGQTRVLLGQDFSSGPPIALDRERNRVLVAEALQRAAMVANNGNLDAACLLLAETESMIANSPSTLARDPVSEKLHEVVMAALRRLDQVLSEYKSRTSGSSILETKPGVWSQPLNQPALPVGMLLGGSVPGNDARTPLKPRTFSVSLPFSSLGSGAARGDANNPSTTTSVGSSSYSSSSAMSLRDDGSSTMPPSMSGEGGGSGSSSASSWRQPRALLLRDNADSSAPSAAADGDSASSARDFTLRSGAGILSKAPPLRLLGSVAFTAGKRGGRVGALRGRPRLQPPVLMPLHAPPTLHTDATAGTPLGIGPPLPPPGASARGVTGSYESWLCRLLRTPLRPLPLPDELIAHIFSFLQPAVLFHESLSLPSLIVDKSTTTVRGHFTTISAALRAAQPGDRLLIRPGVYRESLRIDVPVMLLGCPGVGGSAGAGGGVTITSSRNHTVHSTASFARMENITLRQTGSSGRSCLLVSRGRLDVSDCDISSASGLCVEVTDSAAPIVRHSRIHGGAAAGLWFRAAGGGLVEGNEIWGNGWSGVQISDESNPELLRNYIHDNKSAGIISFNHGKGIARQNDITSNGKGGVQVRSRACPELVCNRIFAERSFGVWVYEHGLGRFEDNDIVNNAWSGFQVEEGSAPSVVGNRLRGNRSAGIVVYNRGSGTYEWNDISCNGRCGVQIKSGSAPTFRHNRIHHEKQAGVLTAEDGTGVLEDNDIFDNQWSGVQTEGPSNPLLRHNRIHHNGGAGFIAYQNGSGLLESNNIYGNKKYGVQSKTGGHPTVRLNRIHDKVYGIYLTESGGGVYEDNRIHNVRGTNGGGIYVAADCSPVLSNNTATV